MYCLLMASLLLYSLYFFFIDVCSLYIMASYKKTISFKNIMRVFLGAGGSCVSHFHSSVPFLSSIQTDKHFHNPMVLCFYIKPYYPQIREAVFLQSGLFYLTRCSLVVSIFQQMASSHCSLWLNKTPLCLCIRFSLCIRDGHNLSVVMVLQ